MRQIRQGLFETNSSSMHSLVVKKKDTYVTPEEAKRDLRTYNDGLSRAYNHDLRFGRSPFQVLYGIKDKALYAIRSLCTYKDETYYEIIRVLQNLVPEFKDFEYDDDAGTYMKKYYTENDMKAMYGEGNYYDRGDNWIYYGYDFGDMDTPILPSFLDKEGITIEEFLTNKKYVVVVDGDEHCIYKNMKKNGLIAMDAIDHEYCPDDWMGGNNNESD